MAWARGASSSVMSSTSADSANGRCSIDLAGLDLGVVEQFLDQREQRVARALHGLGIGRLLRRQGRIHEQAAHADDAVERRADFVAGHCEETRLGAAGGVGLVARLAQRALAFGAVGDVAADALQLGGPAGIVAHIALSPGDPARSQRGFDLLVVNARAVRRQRGIALFENGERAAAADQSFARLPCELAIGVVGKGDAALGIAQHDQVALRFEQAAGALFGFLQFPVTVCHRFVMHGELAHLLAHQPQPDAQRRQRHAGNCKQEAGADRKGMGVIARTFRAAAGDEPIGAAIGGGEDHERADREDQPRVAARKTAYAHFDPESPSHRRFSLRLPEVILCPSRHDASTILQSA